MAYAAGLPRETKIYVQQVAGGRPVALTEDFPGNHRLPRWSSDGSEIAFHSFRAGNRDAFIVSADGGTLYQLTNAPEQDRYPVWSPDGRQIVFLSDDRTVQPELYIVSRERGEVGGETPRQLTFDGVGRTAEWSPSGDVIAYDSSTGDGVRLVPPSGGEPRIVSSFGFMPKWNQDGETIYFRDRTKIWSVPASGGLACW